jgi:hypothetical protein
MHYVKEEELREEIVKCQKSMKMQNIDIEINELKSSPITSEIAEQIAELKAKKQSILDAGFTEKYSKTRFGEMVLQIVQRRATSSKFSGYTYRDEFLSNAIEKILSYALNNFDDQYINPKTGQGSKAFSYVTEIASRAFVAIINEMNEEAAMMNELVPLDSLYQVAKGKAHLFAVATVASRKKEVIEKIEPDVSVKLKWNDGLEFNETKIMSMYDIVREYEGKKLRVEYPVEYNITIDEYEKISELKFEYLDIHKEQAQGYVPSFPKKATKPKEDLTSEWL